LADNTPAHDCGGIGTQVLIKRNTLAGRFFHQRRAETTGATCGRLRRQTPRDALDRYGIAHLDVARMGGKASRTTRTENTAVSAASK
jgi:hypothetical protein